MSRVGVVCWYSLMYLAPPDRPRACGELARVVRPGGYFATAFKAGDDQVRRGGRIVGVEFDIYWLSPDEMQRQVTDAGFHVVCWAGRPATRTSHSRRRISSPGVPESAERPPAVRCAT